MSFQEAWYKAPAFLRLRQARDPPACVSAIALRAVTPRLTPASRRRRQP